MKQTQNTQTNSILTTRFCPIGSLLICLAILLAACSAGASSPPPPPTPTLIPTMVPPPTTVILTSIVDQELLGAQNVQAKCDAPPQTAFVCENESTAPKLNVQINASTYARWSAHWQNAKPLTGDETITLYLNSSGNLSPNLYLDSGDGNRMSVPLNLFGFTKGEQTIHVPLREVRDNKGNSPDLTTVNGIEIVFEWADMQGTMAIESLQINSIWREPVAVGADAVALAAALKAPQGFAIHAIADNLEQITRADFTSKGEMLASQQSGRVWLYRDANGDGVYDERILYTVATPDLVGLLYDPTDGSVWLGSHGELMHTLDTDGNSVADERDIRFEGLPWGRHQNNGMAWNPNPDPFTGEPGGTWLYFGFGSIEDLKVGGPYNAKILRFPRTGKNAGDLQVVSTGNRNAYGVVWAHVPDDLNNLDGPRTWQLFASENGPDFNDAPDEVNHIRWQHNYGFPDQFGPLAAGQVEGDPYSGPVYPVAAHASADGIAYMDNPQWPAEYQTLYISLFGEVFSPTPVGHYIERITLHTEKMPNGEITYRGNPSPFVTGFSRPLPLMKMKNGDMLIGDYATGVVYEIAYQGG